MDLARLDAGQKWVIYAALTFLTFIKGMARLRRMVAYLLCYCGMGLSSSLIGAVVNVAERAIRPAVLYRKGCFGTHSLDGSRFVERMFSVVATLKQQKRNVLEFLTAAYDAHQRGLPPPSLLPAAPSSLPPAA